VPKLAYQVAEAKEIYTVDIACRRAQEYEQYLCNEIHLVREDWGEDSSTFVKRITHLVRIGGDAQSIEETAAFRRKFPDVKKGLFKPEKGITKSVTSGLYSAIYLINTASTVYNIHRREYIILTKWASHELNCSNKLLVCLIVPCIVCVTRATYSKSILISRIFS
jgi:hypothetical protein